MEGCVAQGLINALWWAPWECTFVIQASSGSILHIRLWQLDLDQSQSWQMLSSKCCVWNFTADPFWLDRLTLFGVMRLSPTNLTQAIVAKIQIQPISSKCGDLALMRPTWFPWHKESQKKIVAPSPWHFAQNLAFFRMPNVIHLFF